MGWQSNCIAYRGGYKYQTEADYAIRTGITPEKEFSSDYLAITVDGHLTIKKGYAWDGPSGPTFDTRNFMRGSLVHDALYQLMREKALDSAKHRPMADRLLQAVCEEDGMSRLRAWWVYWGVRLFGDPAADPTNKKPIIQAPKACEMAGMAVDAAASTGRIE